MFCGCAQLCVEAAGLSLLLSDLFFETRSLVESGMVFCRE